VRGEALLLDQVGKGVQVPGIGENGVQHGTAGDAVVAVPDVAAVGIGGDDELGPEGADLADEGLAQVRGLVDTLIRVAQEDDLAYAQDPGGGPLFVLADPDQLGRIEIGIGAALVAVGDHHIDDGLSLADHLGNRAGGTELGIIGVGRNDQDICGLFFHESPLGEL